MRIESSPVDASLLAEFLYGDTLQRLLPQEFGQGLTEEAASHQNAVIQFFGAGLLAEEEASDGTTGSFEGEIEKIFNEFINSCLLSDKDFLLCMITFISQKSDD